MYGPLVHLLSSLEAPHSLEQSAQVTVVLSCLDILLPKYFFRELQRLGVQYLSWERESKSDHERGFYTVEPPNLSKPMGVRIEKVRLQLVFVIITKCHVRWSKGPCKMVQRVT